MLLYDKYVVTSFKKFKSHNIKYTVKCNNNNKKKEKEKRLPNFHMILYLIGQELTL
jgi:hypothetical protein